MSDAPFDGGSTGKIFPWIFHFIKPHSQSGERVHINGEPIRRSLLPDGGGGTKVEANKGPLALRPKLKDGLGRRQSWRETKSDLLPFSLAAGRRPQPFPQVGNWNLLQSGHGRLHVSSISDPPRTFVSHASLNGIYVLSLGFPTPILFLLTITQNAARVMNLPDSTHDYTLVRPCLEFHRCDRSDAKRYERHASLDVRITTTAILI